MKTLFLLFVLCISVHASGVYGYVYREPSYPVARAFVRVYDARGQVVASSYSNIFGYYHLEAPCCDYFVVTATARTYVFEPALLNTAFDDGNGFDIDFVAE